MDLHGADGASGIRLVARQDADYPAWLGRIYAPPPMLWARGRLVRRRG